jgi:hypothetical protein
VDSLGPDGKLPDVVNAPDMVCAVQSGGQERCTTYRIFARYNGATEDRPIPGKLQLVIAPGSDLSRQLDDFNDFGMPLSNVPAQDVQVDLPGGFAPPSAEASVTLTPLVRSPPTGYGDLTMRVLPETGTDVLAELDFTTGALTSGAAGGGMRTVGHDRFARVLRYELRVRQGGASNLNFQMGEMAGHPPEDILRALRFLREVRAPARLQLAARNGPDLDVPFPVNGEVIAQEPADQLIQICEDLATIQRPLFERILMPDLAQHTLEDVGSWRTAAKLLRGEVLEGTWRELPIHLHEDAVISPDIVVGMLQNPLHVKIAARTYPLGTVITQLHSMHVDMSREPTDHDGHKDVWVIPGGDDTATQRLSRASAT